MRLTAWIKRHPVAAFLILAYAWAWVLWSYLLITTPPGGMQAGISPVFFLLAVLGGIGPSLAGLVVSRIVDGPGGGRRLLGQIKRWRVGVSWYALALLIVPAVSLIGLELQVAMGQLVVAGDILSKLPIAIIWPLLASLGEEFGWRAFALPRLQARRTALAASLIIGLSWGMWHLPTDFIGLRAYGWLFIPYFLIAGPLLLTAHSILMTWLYNRTRGSMLIIVLYHFSITSTAILMPTLDQGPAEAILGSLIGVIMFWIIAGILVAKGELGRPEPVVVQGESAARGRPVLR